LRVLQLSKFYPPVVGGIESVVVELTKGLNRLGCRTDVLCAHERATTSVERWPGGYVVTRAASLGRLLSTSMSPRMLGLLSRCAGNYDLIHVHLPDPLANLALWWTRPKAKIVVHWHSDIVQQRLALRVYEPLQQWLLARADMIIATTDRYWRGSPWLRQHAAKIRVLPIGIEDRPQAVPSHQVREIQARYGDRPIVFALGRMVYYKGFQHLIDACRALPQNVAVVIGGDGPLLDEFRRRSVEAGLDDRLHFPGRITEHELAAHFEAIDIFCLPSDSKAEAFGVVLLEGMRAGKPIVASDIDGSGVGWVNEHGKTGLNVPPADATQLAGAIRSLLEDPQRAAEYGAAARRRFLEHFTAQRMVQRCLALYAELGPQFELERAPILTQP
jgi:glycosyltransferase involved in cell wall biosynthesis